MSVPPPLPPQRPLPPGETPKGNSWVSISLAAIVAAMICVGLSLISFGFFAVALAISGVVLGFAGLHYLVWGWWLAGSIRDDDDEETSRSK